MTPNILPLSEGANVVFESAAWTILKVISASEVLARCDASNLRRVLRVDELSSPLESHNILSNVTPDLEAFTASELAEANRRLEIIKPLLSESGNQSAIAVKLAAKSAGVHYTTLYTWLRSYSQTEQITSLVPSRRGRRSGTKLIEPDAEAIITAVIESVYLDKQRPSIKAICDEVLLKCKAARIPLPHPNTVRNRIQILPRKVVLNRRGRKDLARDLYQPIKGKFPGADQPLAMVQIDHSLCDIILVDERHRKPIGRPWLTLAIDVYSRMVVGYHLSLEAPGAHATGLCLSMAILPKATRLNELEIEGDWPVWGFMQVVHCDNAKEFRGKTLSLACKNYGIDLHLRPVRVPHYGGHIERMMGNVARELKLLPGATFSNPNERKGYDSEANAAMTFREYEKHLVETFVNLYHQRVHSSILMSPLKRWNQGILGTDGQAGCGLFPKIVDEHRLRIDFMPFEEKTVQRYGIQMDHLRYYDSCLDPWINSVDKETGKKQKFIIRRDPRDISVAYFYDPSSKLYNELPSRELALPAISLSEYLAVRKQLVDQGHRDIDETLIAKTLEKLRRNTEIAASKSKAARRRSEVQVTQARTLQLSGGAALGRVPSTRKLAHPFTHLSDSSQPVNSQATNATVEVPMRGNDEEDLFAQEIIPFNDAKVYTQ
jgi:putative transposase